MVIFAHPNTWVARAISDEPHKGPPHRSSTIFFLSHAKKKAPKKISDWTFVVKNENEENKCIQKQAHGNKLHEMEKYV